MSKPNNRHIVPKPKNKKPWAVKKTGSNRVSSYDTTQAEAIKRGREIVHNAGGGELVIHRLNGRIRDSDTIAPGNDPFPPRDTK